MEAIVSLTDRGFTGHEHLQEVGLVHMNGRIYDPLIARFMSADPHIQDPLNTQSLNRYTYVNNNPLAYTDPSGYFSIGKIFKSIVNAVKSLIQNPIALISIAVAVVAPYAVVALLPSGLGIGGWVLGAFVGGSLSGAISSGGDIKSTFMSGLISGATAAAFYYVGNFTDGHFGANGKTLGAKLAPADYFGTSNHFLNVAGHAAVGCASSAAGGGSCQAGALSAAAGAFTGPLIGGAPFATKLAVSAAVGGTASVIGGGKFANGAVISAYGYLFNAQAGRLVGGYVGGAVAGALGIESGPGAVVAAFAGRAIGGEVGSAVEDWLFPPKSPGTDIALGFREELRSFASRIGADHLLDDQNWKDTLNRHIQNGTTVFHINMSGFWGNGPKEMITNVMQSNTYTGWELRQLNDAGKLPSAKFYLNGPGTEIRNPFQ